MKAGMNCLPTQQDYAVSEGPTSVYCCFEVKERQASCWKWEAPQPKTSFDGLESMLDTADVGNKKHSKTHRRRKI
jgi:hypothetical protein